MKPPSIAIIGGGPSGLLFARLLELSSIRDYVVFERDESAKPGVWQQGGTLDLHGPSGQLALKRAGLFEDFSTKLARWNATCFHVLDPTAKTVVNFKEERDAPEIDRLQLRQLLLSSIPQNKIRWGHAVSTVERKAKDGQVGKDNGCTIHFTNGTSASGFHLIVGADGSWSKVRHLIIPAKPVYSGKMFIEGIISHGNPIYMKANEIAGPGSMLAIGNQKQISLQQVSNGTYRLYFGLKVPEDFYGFSHNQNASQAQEKSTLHADIASRSETLRQLLLSSDDFYARWAPLLRALIENAEGPFRPWPLYRMDPEAVGWNRDVAPGVTLLGDAAHVSTPFVGEGVNCSMLDAVMLADSIIKYYDNGATPTNDETTWLEHALASYEKEMFVRGRDLIQRSTESEERLFAENAPDLFLEWFNSALQDKS
ncbi:hypothetical protein BGW36DRAFT_389235 [Talaromyces proteolyticus]|uniref:FAD-binding domain-containing protein n=1 Tax=Talaromyces proteolyticus TaxID=1131652 RepID=A0AAD4KKV2_9EURO|nr:uncharacterized protein BGW36DRAFT_389235 [Talaromyces proteolyticus]KAH8690733.1 hypothetical protein BGW36DRAFT_389235 [Talaromyces proteolyticus]